jgi:hypothetical protein
MATTYSKTAMALQAGALGAYPPEPMRIWPISTTRLNKLENDDSSIVEPIVLANSAA